MIKIIKCCAIKTEMVQRLRLLRSVALSTRTSQSYYTLVKFVVELVVFRIDHPSVESRRANSITDSFDVLFDARSMHILNIMLDRY